MHLRDLLIGVIVGMFITIFVIGTRDCIAYLTKEDTNSNSLKEKICDMF